MDDTCLKSLLDEQRSARTHSQTQALSTVFVVSACSYSSCPKPHPTLSGRQGLAGPLGSPLRFDLDHLPHLGDGSGLGSVTGIAVQPAACRC